MQTEIIYKVTKNDLDTVITEKLEKLTKDSVLARFRGVLISPAAVAELHQVHRDTVLKYAKTGLIKFIKVGKLYKFDLSEVLQYDFNELRKTA